MGILNEPRDRSQAGIVTSVRVRLIRHATTAKVGKGLTGWLPGVSLDENGRGQAARLVERMAGEPLDAIYSSPLERTLETAGPLASARGLEIRQLPGVGEIRFGEWQGKDFAEIEKHSSWSAFNQFRSGTPAPGGEMMLETQARFIRAFFEVAAAHDGQDIAIFSHADAIKAALCHFLGIPIDFHLRTEISPASMTIVELYPGLPVVRAVNISEKGMG